MSEAPFEHLYQEEVYLVPARTTVVIDKPWTDVTDDERTLLIKILGSVKLGLAQVQIISKKELTAIEMRAIAPERLIVFGSGFKEVPGLYEFTTVGGIPVIRADSLGLLDDPRKKNLWLALRKMFGI